jgi:hypothetical protein
MRTGPWGKRPVRARDALDYCLPGIRSMNWKGPLTLFALAGGAIALIVNPNILVWMIVLGALAAPIFIYLLYGLGIALAWWAATEIIAEGVRKGNRR